MNGAEGMMAGRLSRKWMDWCERGKREGDWLVRLVGNHQGTYRSERWNQLEV